ncbi:hypothetical protein Vlu01_00140 [Micromonospora lutea]|uniref:Uncharacterized protein n=1 Tax=Micromonospora lutea TaxID=419825 RepID=A0ABQ4INA0_9ACTN|nr:hypothetical protein Vlu01_00140 [Micromonospora lutea]
MINPNPKAMYSSPSTSSSEDPLRTQADGLDTSSLRRRCSACQAPTASALEPDQTTPSYFVERIPDPKPGWKDVLDATRREYRIRQIAAVVRSNPATAVATLKRLGYEVRNPDGRLLSSLRKLTHQLSVRSGSEALLHRAQVRCPRLGPPRAFISHAVGAT